jgi:cytochrome c553
MEGRSAVYLKAQLEAFANTSRRNDISQQMAQRCETHAAEEIGVASEYYAAQPPEPVSTAGRPEQTGQRQSQFSRRNIPLLRQKRVCAGGREPALYSVSFNLPTI